MIPSNSVNDASHVAVQGDKRPSLRTSLALVASQRARVTPGQSGTCLALLLPVIEQMNRTTTLSRQHSHLDTTGDLLSRATPLPSTWASVHPPFPKTSSPVPPLVHLAPMHPATPPNALIFYHQPKTNLQTFYRLCLQRINTCLIVHLSHSWSILLEDPSPKSAEQSLIQNQHEANGLAQTAALSLLEIALSMCLQRVP